MIDIGSLILSPLDARVLRATDPFRERAVVRVAKLAGCSGDVADVRQLKFDGHARQSHAMHAASSRRRVVRTRSRRRMSQNAFPGRGLLADPYGAAFSVPPFGRILGTFAWLQAGLMRQVGWHPTAAALSRSQQPRATRHSRPAWARSAAWSLLPHDPPRTALADAESPRRRGDVLCPLSFHSTVVRPSDAHLPRARPEPTSRRYGLFAL